LERDTVALLVWMAPLTHEEYTMNPKTKSRVRSTIFCAVLFFPLSASQASVETTQAPNGAKVTKIRVNGRFAFAFLNDGDTNGFLNASKDQITDTSALDFGYAFPDPAHPDFVILIQGAGEIPNSAFTLTTTTAHLAVTTPFEVIRCDLNTIDGTYVCNPTTPITFDVTWTLDGFGTIFEKTKSTQTFGPVSTKFHGEFSRLTATVNETWDGHTNTDGIGDLQDSQNVTFIREITLEPNP
jgi:hypothetical protein